MNHASLFVVIFLLCCDKCLVKSAPSFGLGGTVVGFGFGVSPIGFADYGYYPGYYSGYGYGRNYYRRRYRYPHFYPPIAVLAG